MFERSDEEHRGDGFREGLFWVGVILFLGMIILGSIYNPRQCNGL